MKRTGWLVFCLVVFIGGGLNLLNIGAKPGDNRTKMEQAKEELLAKPTATLKIQGCEVTIKALKLAYPEKDELVVKICATNPAPVTATLVIPLRVDSTTSSMLMRMMPVAKLFLEQRIEVTVPPKGSGEQDVVLVSRAKPKDAPKVPADDQASYFGETTTYDVYVLQPDKGKEVRTLMCAFTGDKVIPVLKTKDVSNSTAQK